jgi:hypothetical protein
MWRATHILTAKRDLAIIPNSTIAKSKIVNVSSPSGVHGVTVTVQVEPGTSPSRIAEFLERAVLNCLLILRTPAPSVTVKSMNSAYTEFAVDFFVPTLGASAKTQNDLFDLIYRHLTTSGVGLAPPADQASGAAQNRTAEPARPRTEALLDLLPVFAPLAIAERAAVAPKLQRRSYEEGETLLEPGTVMHSLCFVGSGVLSCLRDRHEGDEELTRFGPGDQFGEIGVLTGEPSPVRITALTPAIVYELPKDEFGLLVEAHPELSKLLNAALTARQTAISAPDGAPETAQRPLRLSSRFFDWLQHRYDLLDTR